MKIAALDCETTTKSKGSPFHSGNTLCLVGMYGDGIYHTFDIEYSGKPYKETLNEIKSKIEALDLLILFNGKFDLHWIRRYIPNVKLPAVWDCQLAEFILGTQRESYPALNDVANRRGLGSKLDVVAKEYWDLGIDTDKVPLEILEEYLKQDVMLTYAVYLQQIEEARSKNLFSVIKLCCDDLLVLQEMEFNGMRFNEAESEENAKRIEGELARLNTELCAFVPESGVNWSSGDHVSAVLYGGSIHIPCRVSTFRTLKNGSIKVGEKNGTREVAFPQLIKPLKNSETLPTSKYKTDEELRKVNELRRSEAKKPFTRIYSVDEATLRSVTIKGKKAQAIVDRLLRRSENNKLLSTYYRGIPDTIRDNGWASGEIHGQFNQCVARTGRLSSSKPNQQNFAGIMKHLFVSRYK